MRIHGRQLRFRFDRFSGLYLWALFIVVFGIWTPSRFLTGVTVHAIASEEALAAIVALAVLIPLSAGMYDLSVGATVNLSTILVTVLQVREGWSMGPAIVAAIVVGLAVGVTNAILVVRLRVNSFIATLGMTSVLAAVQSIVTAQEQPPPIFTSSWTSFTQDKLFGFQLVVLYLIIAAIIVWWFLEHTPAGRYIYATGGNSDAARLSGVRTDRWSAISLILSATICGVVGVFYASLTGPSLTFGSSLLLPAFAAAFLGSTQLKPGRFNVWGTLLAVYVLATGIKGMQLITGVQWLGEMFNGVALITAVAFAGWQQRRASSARALRRDLDFAEPGDPPPEAGDGAPAGAGALSQ
jgi:ribose transport system permease protein